MGGLLAKRHEVQGVSTDADARYELTGCLLAAIPGQSFLLTLLRENQLEDVAEAGDEAEYPAPTILGQSSHLLSNALSKNTSSLITTV
jgi:hypothetical protein